MGFGGQRLGMICFGSGVRAHMLLFSSRSNGVAVVIDDSGGCGGGGGGGEYRWL